MQGANHVFTYYLNSFYTIDFYTFYTFATDFLYCVFNYLAQSQHFPQIDSYCSSFQTAKYSLLQDSILFPCYSSIAPDNTCMQYGDDSTLYRSFIRKKKDTCIKEFVRISTHLQNSPSKITWCLRQVNQNLLLKHIHDIGSLKDEQFKICCNNITMESVSE